MKSKFEWEFYGCWVAVDGETSRFCWMTHTTPQFRIEGRMTAEGASRFDVYEGSQMIEYGWTTLIRAKRFVDYYSVGKAKAIQPFTHHEENLRDS